jgi:ribosomal protein S18 acetylase RimI-like enzyme
MDSPVLVRTAAPADLPAIVPIWREVDRLHREALPERFCEPEGDWPDLAELEALAEGRGGTILVADAEGAAAGFVVLLIGERPDHPVWRRRRFVEVNAMGVAVAARRNGVGRALLEAAAAWAAAMGADELELNVYAFNAEARAFYEAMGFAPLMQRMARPA